MIDTIFHFAFPGVQQEGLEHQAAGSYLGLDLGQGLVRRLESSEACWVASHQAARTAYFRVESSHYLGKEAFHLED